MRSFLLLFILPGLFAVIFLCCCQDYLWGEVISPTQDIYLLQEDMDVNNIPVLADSPFYDSISNGHKLTDIKPYAEHVYSHNLKLDYKKNDLQEEADGLWINPHRRQESSARANEQNRSAATPHLLAFDKLNSRAIERWTYQLREDNREDFVFEDRQWNKKYVEGLDQPVIYKGTVILRNEYRLFGLDLISGKEAWSLGDVDGSGLEYYSTFRHPHHNSYGHELLLDDGVVYAELAENLVAVNVRNIGHPQLLWKLALGEYTLSAAPVKVKGVLIVGLVNARGENWFCGVDPRDGHRIWSSYIGISSFLGPVCPLHAVHNEKVFIGTNHGVLVCLNAGDGVIDWIKKYTPKTYSLIDPDKNDHDSNRIGTNRKTVIRYDTQFIKLEENGLLYYKARESDQLYVLDPGSGKVKNSLLIDHQSYLLGEIRGKAVFLKKSADAASDWRVRTVDLDSGREIDAFSVKEGSLKGVGYVSNDSLVFKMDAALYFLRVRGDKGEHKNVDSSSEGWLAGVDDGVIFIADKNKITSLDFLNGASASGQTSAGLADLLKKRDVVVSGLAQMLQAGTDPGQIRMQQVFSDIVNFNIPLSQLMPVITRQLKALHAPQWKSFISQLLKSYPDDVVLYRGIYTRFVNFASSAGLFSPLPAGQEKIALESKKSARAEALRLKGMNDLRLLPVQIVKGPPLWDRFLVLNNDQVLCINEAWDIVWARNIKCDRHHHYLKAYLHDDVLMINDGTNVVAVNAADGKYLWSMTGKEPLYVVSLGARFILMNDDEAYLVDPATGYVKRSTKLNAPVTTEPKVRNGSLFLLSTNPRKITILDEDLKIKSELLLMSKDHALDPPADDGKALPELWTMGDFLIWHENPYIYVVDGKTGMVSDRFHAGSLGRYDMDVHQEQLFLITPCEKIAAWGVNHGLLEKQWEFIPQADGQAFLQEKGVASGKTDSYFIGDGYLLMPFRKADKYVIDSVDTRSGQKMWEIPVGDMSGLFSSLYCFKGFDGKVWGILSTAAGRFEEIYTESELFLLDISGGKAETMERLPPVVRRIEFKRNELLGTGGMVKNKAITETKSWFIYDNYERLISSITKKAE